MRPQFFSVYEYIDRWVDGFSAPHRISEQVSSPKGFSFLSPTDYFGVSSISSIHPLCQSSKHGRTFSAHIFTFSLRQQHSKKHITFLGPSMNSRPCLPPPPKKKNCKSAKICLHFSRAAPVSLAGKIKQTADGHFALCNIVLKLLLYLSLPNSKIETGACSLACKKVSKQQSRMMILDIDFRNTFLNICCGAFILLK